MMLLTLAPGLGVTAAACGAGPSQLPSPSTGPVKITYWEQRTAELGERFAKAAQSVNQQSAKVVLEVTPVPPGAGDLRAKLVAAAAGSVGPDVMLHNTLEVTGYLNTDLLLDLESRLKGNRDWGQRRQYLTARTLAGHTWNGKLVTLPAITSAIAVFYNRDLLRQAGVAEPPANWSWDSFVDICRKVKTATQKWGCSFPPPQATAAVYWHNWAACNNVTLVDPQRGRSNVTSAEALEVTRFLEDMVVRQEQFMLAGIARDGRQPPDGTPFATGQAAFETQLPATIQSWDALKLNSGVAPMPAKRRSSSYAIPDHTIIFKTGKGEREAAAIEFGLWVAKPETQVLYATLTNRSPVYTDVQRRQDCQQYL
jgi:multiple sugar transport system substrate-binding protein